MLPKVLLLFLSLFLTPQLRVQGPMIAFKSESPAHEDVVYGPEPQPLERKLLAEETKPTMPTGRQVGKLPEASRILNTILSNYDHKLRPGIGEKPAVVTVEFSVNSLGPLSILDMEYNMDIIFYQTWYDERLRYNDTFETLVLNGNVVSQLWIPDTFFKNSKRTQEHAITMSNQMVRVHKDGKVLCTIRMTIDAGCSLHMVIFPMDSHSWPLSFSSFSYHESELLYKWEDFQLEINEKNSWKLFQFDFTGVSNRTEIISTPAGDFMVMTFFFNVSRRFGFVAVQNYVPSSVTTMLSWVSFWIKKESAPARTSLGITSVLIMTTLGTFSRKNFPRVSYGTVLDFYIAICFVFCFCALMEFAVLNFLTYSQMKAHASLKLHHPCIDSRAYARTCARARACARAHTLQEVFVCEIVTSDGSDGEEHPSCSAQRSPSPGSPEGPPSLYSRLSCCAWCKGLKKYFCMVPDCEGSTWQNGCLCIHIYPLDNYSQILFPVTFLIFNVLYWLVCLNL
ncbi:gamma-aminobutyric acid receptor subunit epsilon [Microcebus murinus]|uniref:Gamma-aminobutyric acid receptor subunit epsilon n=1 Tax=Microcebus murinus TaxID=30608 RepID=A0A8B7EDF8_MICMU|nr:gamma-aminobutyric acid receptor subunit epsilon [Microcebus murinus]